MDSQKYKVNTMTLPIKGSLYDFDSQRSNPQSFTMTQKLVLAKISLTNVIYYANI